MPRSEPGTHCALNQALPYARITQARNVMVLALLRTTAYACMCNGTVHADGSPTVTTTPRPCPAPTHLKCQLRLRPRRGQCSGPYLLHACSCAVPYLSFPRHLRVDKLAIGMCTKSHSWLRPQLPTPGTVRPVHEIDVCRCMRSTPRNTLPASFSVVAKVRLYCNGTGRYPPVAFYTYPQSCRAAIRAVPLVCTYGSRGWRLQGLDCRLPADEYRQAAFADGS